MILASPDAGVACPVFGILILLIYLVGNLFESVVRGCMRQGKQRKPEPRGFEVKLDPGSSPVEQRKENDHG